MLSMSDIKQRLKSINETKQITKAMHLISSAKVKKAMQRYESNKSYQEKVRYTIKDILKHSESIEHVYLEHNEGGRAAYIVISADKGFAGGYNHNVLNLALSHMQDKAEKYILTVGYVGKNFFEHEGYMVDIEFLNTAQDPSLYNARQIAYDILDLYENRVMDEVYIAYTAFLSPIKQEPRVLKLLPVEMEDFQDVTTADYSADMLYLPSPKEVFDRLIPEYLIGVIYSALVQSFVSEQYARMVAMDSSTKNATKMINKLTSEYNRARQHQITQEIAEIVGGADALLGKDGEANEHW